MQIKTLACKKIFTVALQAPRVTQHECKRTNGDNEENRTKIISLITYMKKLLDSDWLRKKLLNSDWLRKKCKNV